MQSRVYYDAQNPRMLTREDFAGLSPSEVAALSEQIDQNLVAVLQKIDENFVSATRSVTDKVLPSIERYGRSSKQIWDSVKFWKTFFEASAGLRLADTYASPPPSAKKQSRKLHDDGDENQVRREAEQEDYHDEDGDGDVTAREEDQAHAKILEEDKEVGQLRVEQEQQAKHDFLQPEPTAKGPRKAPGWADEESPFDKLREDIRLSQEASVQSSFSSIPAPPPQAPSYGRAQTRLADLSVDSPDFERPVLESLPAQQTNQDKKDKGKGQQLQYEGDYRNHIGNPSGFFREGSEAPTSEASTTFDLSSLEPPLTGNTAKTDSARSDQLLHKVLNKKLARNERPNASTPGRKKHANRPDLPPDLPAHWDGIADLSQTPLSSFDSPQKRGSRFATPTTASIRKSRHAAPPSSNASTLILSSSPPAQAGNGTRDEDDDDYGRPAFMRNPVPAPQPSHRPASSTSRATRPDAYDSPPAYPPPFSVSKFRLAKTPAKEAAHLITRSALQNAALRTGGRMADADEDPGLMGMESPMLEPPSVVKNWATRGYTTNFGALDERQEKSRQDAGGSPGGFDDGDEVEDSFELGKPSTSANVSRVPAQPDFFAPQAKAPEQTEEEEQEAQLDYRAAHTRLIVDEDAEAEAGVGERSDWEDSFEADEEGDSADFGRGGGDGFEETEVPLAGGDDSLDENSRSMDEETVFGGKRASLAPRAGRSSAAAGAGGGYGLGGDDGQGHTEFFARQAQDRQQQPALPRQDGLLGQGKLQAGKQRASERFRLNGPDDMVTLHGGDLLESQPFQNSPLAGRDARYGL